MNDMLISLLPSIISSILALICWQFKRAINKREEEEKKREKLAEQAKQEEELKQLQRDTEIKSLVTNLVYITQQLEVVKKANTKYDEQIQEILETINLLKKNALVITKKDLTKTFHKAQKEQLVPTYIKEVTSEEIKLYEELGGNSYIHNEYQKFINLPTEN